MRAEQTAHLSKIYLLLVITLGLFVLVESVVIVNHLQKVKMPVRLPSGERLVSTLELKKGTLAIIPKEEPSQLREDFIAQLIINSLDESIIGVDVILNFDPEILKVVKISPNQDLFEQITVNQKQQTEGRIKITAYLPKEELTGEYLFSFLTLRLLKDQPTDLEIEFIGPDRVTDSNLISQKTQKDILGDVQSLSIKLNNQ